MGGVRATRAPSLRLRLLSLVLLLAAALMALAGIAVWQAHEAGRARAADQMLGTVRALASLVDREFARAEALLQGLEADPNIAAGDADAFMAAAGRLGNMGDDVVLVLAAAPNRQVATSVEGRLATQRPIPGGLEAVFATGRTTISDLYLGGVTGRPMIGIAVPVRPPDGGAPVHALGVTLSRAGLTASLLREHLPPGAVAAVLDRRNIVVARTRREAEIIGRPATPRVIADLSERDAGIIEHVANHDGEVSVAAFARAPASGYAVVMALPEGAFAAERNAALRRLGLHAAPVALAALLVAFLLGLRLRAALAGLSAGAGGAAPQLAEVAELARALAAADAARAASEAEARDRNAWLEATQRAAQVGTWDLDLQGGSVRWSAVLSELVGLDPARHGPPSAELFRSRIIPEDRPMVDAARARAMESGAYEAEFRIRHTDGDLRWLRSQGVLERDAQGRPQRLLGALLDITERRRLEAEREALAAQKDLLVQEMHHRVKNSLQLVQGLLLMQARGAEPVLEAKLKEAAGRIVSIAAVHRRLYEGGPGPHQDAADHLAGLAEDLRRSVGGGGRDIALHAQPGVTLPPERMAALGLLATELVTNALKHGAGRVTLHLTHAEGLAELRVEDEGPGFPAGFDPAQSRGLGMRVALAMARQLRGSLRTEPGPPGRVVVTLPIRSPSSPTPEDPAASR